MAITQNDSQQTQIFSTTLTVGGTLTFTSQISGIRNTDVTLLVEVNGLDADVELSQLQGLKDDITKMTPILDVLGNDIVTLIDSTEDEYTLISINDSVYFGLSMDILTATTGSLTITGWI